MLCDPFRLREEHLQLLMHDILQVRDGNLVAALAADILGTARADIHLVPAKTMRQTAEQMHWRFAGLLPRFQLFLNMRAYTTDISIGMVVMESVGVAIPIHTRPGTLRNPCSRQMAEQHGIGLERMTPTVEC